MHDSTRASSPRRDELLERAYEYALRNGLADLSLRPLAAAIGSSPRVLLFLFGSKDALVRALLNRARADELTVLDGIRHDAAHADLPTIVRVIWQWLVDPRHQPLLVLWLEAYARSLSEPNGPWDGFARQTVEDWLAVLADAQTPTRQRGGAGAAERSLALAVLRGAVLDLLATGDSERSTAAVEHYLRNIADGS